MDHTFTTKMQEREKTLRGQASEKRGQADEHERQNPHTGIAMNDEIHDAHRNKLRGDAKKLDKEADVAKNGKLGAYKRDVEWNMNNADIVGEASGQSRIEYLDEE